PPDGGDRSARLSDLPARGRGAALPRAAPSLRVVAARVRPMAPRRDRRALGVADQGLSEKVSDTIFTGKVSDAIFRLAPGAVVLRGFALERAAEIRAALDAVTASAPFRHMTTPGNRQMSVAMTNCGALGWVSDRKGY